MTFFISMPTLEDSETRFTINNAYEMADSPDDIYFGIACTSSKEYYNSLKSEFEDNKNVRIKWFNPAESIGVGLGRNRSFAMYDGEENILQIDSHTYFRHSWDSYLRKTWYDALDTTNSEKTIVTAYLSLYKHLQGMGRVPDQFKSTYPFFTNNKTTNQLNTNIPKFKNVLVKEFPKEIKRDYVYKKFFPSIKFNAHFALGGQAWAEDSGLPDWAYFWEEEVVQTINLLDKGFNLVFPNREIPLCHLYMNDTTLFNKNSVSSRMAIADLLEQNGIEDKNIANINYNNFISDPSNQEKLQNFHKWSGVHPEFGPIKEWTIPKTYSIIDK